MVKDLEQDLNVRDKIWMGTDLSTWADCEGLCTRVPMRICTEDALNDLGGKPAPPIIVDVS